MIDDAHGFGVLGDNGRGTLEHAGVSTAAVPVYMATLGKALGTAGAFVSGSDELVETLIQRARTYIYTTATPAAVAEATRASLKLIQTEPQWRERLQQNIRYFRNCCNQTNIQLSESKTAIQPIIIGDTEETVRMSNTLFSNGILVTAIRPPTVPEGTARLRITLSAAHNSEQIDKLISALNTIRQ
jgi:8-amino-7-oxononanoate synthase